MKKLNYVIVFSFVFFVSISLAQATETRSSFNNYEISRVQDLHMGKHIQAVWRLSYSADEIPVTVVKRKTFEGIEYRVQSEYFSVCYLATPESFGVKDSKCSWSTVPKKINRAVINQQELNRQEIITNQKVSDNQALGLIASYLPDLVNDGYTHLLN